jgi:hypothetical protein
VSLLQQPRRELQPPRRQVSHGRLSQPLAEAPGEHGAGRSDVLGERSDGPLARGLRVQVRQRARDERVAHRRGEPVHAARVQGEPFPQRLDEEQLGEAGDETRAARAQRTRFALEVAAGDGEQGRFLGPRAQAHERRKLPQQRVRQRSLAPQEHADEVRAGIVRRLDARAGPLVLRARSAEDGGQRLRLGACACAGACVCADAMRMRPRQQRDLTLCERGRTPAFDGDPAARARRDVEHVQGARAGEQRACELQPRRRRERAHARQVDRHDLRPRRTKDTEQLRQRIGASGRAGTRTPVAAHLTSLCGLGSTHRASMSRTGPHIMRVR